jgi:hypothetical protein
MVQGWPWAKRRDSIQKITKVKRAQEVERLPSKDEALSLNPSTTKKKKK